MAILPLFFYSSIVKAQKVYAEQYESNADVKVFVVQYESEADLKVYKEQYRIECRPERWQMVFRRV